MQLPQKTSLNSFHPNSFKTNVYHYYRGSSIKYIQEGHVTTKKKLVYSLFMLISCKSMSITIINYIKTHL